MSSDKLSTETFGSDPKCEHRVCVGIYKWCWNWKTWSQSVGALWGFQGKQQCDCKDDWDDWESHITNSRSIMHLCRCYTLSDDFRWVFNFSNLYYDKEGTVLIFIYLSFLSTWEKKGSPDVFVILNHQASRTWRIYKFSLRSANYMLCWKRTHNPDGGSGDETTTAALCFFGRTNLISLCVLTHERLVIGGKCRSVVIDVQDSDVNRHTADLSRVV